MDLRLGGDDKTLSRAYADRWRMDLRLRGDDKTAYAGDLETLDSEAKKTWIPRTTCSRTGVRM